MAVKSRKYEEGAIESRILTVRRQKVILDSDLAALYGVPTFRFNEAVKRNRRRFPRDFMFRLTPGKFAALISQAAMSKTRPRGSANTALCLHRAWGGHGGKYSA
jgi:hypothetical protein